MWVSALAERLLEPAPIPMPTRRCCCCCLSIRVYTHTRTYAGTCEFVMVELSRYSGFLERLSRIWQRPQIDARGSCPCWCCAESLFVSLSEQQGQWLHHHHHHHPGRGISSHLISSHLCDCHGRTDVLHVRLFTAIRFAIMCGPTRKHH